jgi:prefoldin subunit 5
MTIEERLEKLTERHEALTQAVELIAGRQRETERRLETVVDMQRQNEQRFAQVVVPLSRLVRVAESHEHRLDGLEGRT